MRSEYLIGYKVTFSKRIKSNQSYETFLWMPYERIAVLADAVIRTSPFRFAVEAGWVRL